jgi:hypothetical protein
MKMKNRVKQLTLKNRGITFQEVCNILGISFWSVQSNLKENLIMCHNATKFMFCPALCFVCAAISGQKQKDCRPTSPYSSDIAPCNFLFSEHKMSIKGRRHIDITTTQAKPWDALAKFQILHLMKGSNGGAIT